MTHFLHLMMSRRWGGKNRAAGGRGVGALQEFAKDDDRRKFRLPSRGPGVH